MLNPASLLNTSFRSEKLYSTVSPDGTEVSMLHELWKAKRFPY